MGNCFIGIDVSKGYADFVVLDDNAQERLEVFRLDDTAKGHQKLKALIQEWYQADETLCFYAAVESTGGLENNWLHHLGLLAQALPLFYTRINPKGVAQYIKADLTRTVTDGVSAKAIATYQIAHHKKIRYNEPPRLLEHLKASWSTFVLFKKQRQRIANNLHPLLYTAHPGLMRFCRRGIPAWLAVVLQRYPTAARLAKARVSTLSKIPYVSEARARTLIEVSKQSCASRSDDASAQTIALLAAELQHIQQTINKFEKIMTAQAASDPQVQLLCSFKGIATTSAIGLLINMPQIEAIQDASKLSAYWGLHPVFKQSGDAQSVARMSKAGRVQPRSILFMVALSAIACNPLIRDLYKRKVRSGMKPMAAIGVCMHKIARICFGMLKSAKPFDPAVDEKNSQKMPKISSESATQRQRHALRRLQQEDPAAPISRRERKKRAAVAEPQNAMCVKCEVIDQKATTVSI